MTREALSDKSGVSIMTIRRYESLERVPRFDVLEKLATAMDCTVFDFTEEREGEVVAIGRAGENIRVNGDSVGERIKQFRLNKGLSQQQLGSMIGMSQQQVGQYEKSVRIPKPATLDRFASALDCTVPDLLYNKADIEFNQGYEIVEKETYRICDTGRADAIVLARMSTKYGTQFVTWESAAYLRDDRPLEYFWGHYFSEEDQARADYHRRLLKKYEDKATQDE
jgi:transcriptional regulator with XRE-family HTH domain